MKMTDAFEFHEKSLNLTLPSLVTAEGPSSMKRPIRDEQPGPPFNQSTTGSFLGSLRDSKNPGEALASVANGRFIRVLTVKQMLVLLVVIEIATVLLDLVDAQRGRIDLLDAQVVVLELAVDLALLLAIGILDPDTLDVGTLDDVVPLVIRLARVRLRGGEEGGLLKRLGEHEGYLVPDAAGLAGERLQRLLEVVQWLCP